MESAKKHMLDSAVSMEVGSRRSYLTWDLNDGQDFASGAQGEEEDITGEQMAYVEAWPYEKAQGFLQEIPNYT